MYFFIFFFLILYKNRQKIYLSVLILSVKLVNMAQNKSKVLQIPNYIKNTSKVLLAVNKKLAAVFALKLFETPIKHNLPKREQKMFDVSQKNILKLPTSGKEIMEYENTFGSPKVLLVHGWNGRGTQLVTIAKLFKELGYKIVSFDAPGHGKTIKDTANMKHFIEAIFELDKKHQGFDVIIGHSLGGMSTINALGRGLQAKKAIIIGSGNKTHDIVADFLNSIGMGSKINSLFVKMFNHKENDDITNYDVVPHAKNVTCNVLVLHDKNDDDVPYTASVAIHENLTNSKLVLTENLGHRKILGDEKVISIIEKFVTN